MKERPKIKLLQDMEENINKIMNTGSIFSEKKMFLAPTRPATYSEIQRLMIENLRKSPVSSTEILYTKDKELIRTITDRKVTYSFMDKKRATVFEYLVESSNYVSTNKLLSVSESPSEGALRKLIQGMNTAIKNKLKLNDRIIIGRQGFGYIINKKFSIISE